MNTHEMFNLILWNFPGEEGYPRLATILEIGFHGTTIKKIGFGSLGFMYHYVSIYLYVFLCISMNLYVRIYLSI